MAKQYSEITGEHTPFFCQTEERTEWFATLGAAQLFIELHCPPYRRDSNAERLVRTNAY
jgi:hypothetical protein